MKISALFSLVFIILLFSSVSPAMSRRPLYVTPSDKYHIVQPGDTLYRISRKNGISIDNLKLYNKLTDDKIVPGQKIYLYPRSNNQAFRFVTERPIPDGHQHIVEKGETLSIIAKLYNIDLLELIHFNIISDWELESGQVIYLTDGMISNNVSQSATIQEKTKVTEEHSSRTDKEKSKRGKDKKVKMSFFKREDFISPLETFRITQKFDKKVRHQGIDLAAPAGTPIFAVKSGTVVYSGTQRGYGNLIILEHNDNFMTVYAHNEINMVEAGEKVKQGEQIGTVGNTGRSTGNHLHFEIRKDGIATDPAPHICALGR